MLKYVSSYKEEYVSLRAEILERISIMNTQGQSAISVVIAFWAAGLALMGIRIGFNPDNTLQTYQLIGLCMGESISFCAALWILCPLSLKSAENINQLAALSAYIKVFHEWIPGRHGVDMHPNWETIDAKTNHMKTVQKMSGKCLYNSEYQILGILSMSLFVISVISYAGIIRSDTQSSVSTISVVITVIIYTLIIKFDIFCFYKICKASSVKKHFQDYLEDATKRYKEIAKEEGLIEPEESSIGNMLKM